MDDELKSVLGQLLAKMDTLATKEEVNKLATTVDTLAAKVDTLDVKVDKLATEFSEHRTETSLRLGIIDARLDEQRHVLVAMIPKSLAAMPPVKKIG